MIPKGVKDFLPINAVKIEYLKSSLQGIFSQWGFQPVTPPSLEFLHVLERGLGSELKECTQRFDDRQSGKLLAFPPDITPQIARVFATRMQEAPLPQRLSYSCRVLRHTEEQAGKDRELFQSGVELIGHAGPEADAEMISMALECLDQLDAPDYTIDIGQVEFYRGVLDSLDAPAEQIANIQNAILHKDSSGLKQHLESMAISDQTKSEILALPRLFGARDVLDRAAAVVNNDRSKRALDNLHNVLKILEVYGVDQRITFDLGELRGLDYYTGVTFQGFLTGYGQAVCLGGRYDNLTAGYGHAAPATGFAFNLLNLLFAMPQQLAEKVQPSTDALVVSTEDNSSQCHLLAQALRKQNYSICVENQHSADNAREYALKMNFRYLLTVTAATEQVEVFSLKEGTSQTYSVSDLTNSQIAL